MIPADPARVLRRIAESYLAAPAIDLEQGEIRLAAHQVDAASRLLAMLEAHGGALLADATGLGKTFVATAVARVLGPTLVVAPAALRGMWRESLGRTGVAAGIETYERLSRGRLPDGERPRLLVLDEAHHARNPRSARYAALADLAWGAWVLLLTATPVHNRGRDVRALLALFVGSRAHTMPDDEVRRFIVRRTSGAIGPSGLPDLGAPVWLAVPRDPDTLRRIAQIPPPVPASGGGTAHALTILGLIRAWTSSEAALRATLRRRLRRAAAFVAALESGRNPDRRELRNWPVIDDAIQLGIPGLFAPGEPLDVGGLRDALDVHVEGVRAVLQSLDQNGGASDHVRWRHLEEIERKTRVPVVAFTQFADTAHAAFRATVHKGAVALVSGGGARVASGRVNVDDIVRGFDLAVPQSARAMPLELLIATDVLSEGLSLRRAGALVHLDLPWTIARLEQRVGRLRRLGSRHPGISVYALGPPVESRELVSVLRALQRKARLSMSLVDSTDPASSLPLFGSRLRRATERLVERQESSTVELLRRMLSTCAAGAPHECPAPDAPEDGRFVAVGLVARGARPLLVAIVGDRASDHPADVLRALRAVAIGITRDAATVEPGVIAGQLVPLLQWLDEERGRELAQPAVEAHSAAHAGVLRALHERLTVATRSERSTLVPHIDRCRRLVISARGVGAEWALARLAEGARPLDLDRLEDLISSRRLPDAGRQSAAVVAVIGLDPLPARRIVGFFAAESPAG